MSLTALTATVVYPPINCRAVEIGNATPDDLRVYRDPTTADYFIVPSGFNKPIDLKTARFSSDVPAFYLYALQAGTAVLNWL